MISTSSMKAIKRFIINKPIIISLKFLILTLKDK
jgi:hypothetical protein